MKNRTDANNTTPPARDATITHAGDKQAYGKPSARIETSDESRRSVFAACCTDTACAAAFTFVAEASS